LLKKFSDNTDANDCEIAESYRGKTDVDSMQAL